MYIYRGQICNLILEYLYLLHSSLMYQDCSPPAKFWHSANMERTCTDSRKPSQLDTQNHGRGGRKAWAPASKMVMAIFWVQNIYSFNFWGVHPWKLTCHLKRSHFKRKGLSSNHPISGDMLVFEGVSLFIFEGILPKDPTPQPDNLHHSRRPADSYQLQWHKHPTTPGHQMTSLGDRFGGL